MSFTRFHDDPARIRKRLQETTFAENYYINTPGNGINMAFQLDPQLRLQGWGANMHTNAIQLESDFRGLTRRLNRDLIDENNYKGHQARTTKPLYPSANPITDESRSTYPAWELRDLEQTRWDPLDTSVVAFEMPFLTNVQTRSLERDNYKYSLPNTAE